MLAIINMHCMHLCWYHHMRRGLLGSPGQRLTTPDWLETPRSIRVHIHRLFCVPHHQIQTVTLASSQIHLCIFVAFNAHHTRKWPNNLIQKILKISLKYVPLFSSTRIYPHSGSNRKRPLDRETVSCLVSPKTSVHLTGLTFLPSPFVFYRFAVKAVEQAQVHTPILHLPLLTGVYGNTHMHPYRRIGTCLKK